MNHHWIAKGLMMLGICECLIILLCQLVDKQSLLYINLQRMNIAMYLPSMENQITGGHHPGPPIAGPGGGGRGVGGGGTQSYSWLLKGPLFSHYNISEPPRKKRVSVIIIVSSGPMRFDRRQAIRDTWWEECKPVKDVSIRFITLPISKGYLL